MGKFQKVNVEDEDDVETSTLFSSLPPQPPKFQRLYLGCLTRYEALLLLVAVVLFGMICLKGASLAMDAAVKRSLVLAGSGVLGVETRVGAVKVGIFQRYSSVSDLRVDNPPGFGGIRQGVHRLDFLSLEEGDFGTDLASIFTTPLNLMDVKLRNLHVNLEQRNTESNVKYILSHAMAAAKERRSRAAAVRAGASSLADGVASLPARSIEAGTNRIIADSVLVQNVSSSVCIHPVCDKIGSVSFSIKHVLVKNIGKQTDGVSLHEFIEIVIQAVLVAAIQAAPEEVGYDVHRSVGSNLESFLDHVGVNYDIGAGFQEARDWTSWHLSRIGGSIASAVGAKGDAEDQDIVNDMVNAGGNLSSALHGFGEAFRGSLEVDGSDLSKPEQRARAEARGSKAAKKAAQNLEKAKDEGLREASVIANHVVGVLTEKGSSAAKNLTDAAEEAKDSIEEATQAVMDVMSDKVPDRDSIDTSNGKHATKEALKVAANSLEKATGYKNQLISTFESIRHSENDK